MIFDDKISVLIPVPQALGTGEHQRQEHFPCALSSACICTVQDTSYRHKYPSVTSFQSRD